jgi:site-specific DNA-methyltransferase (adenine-specific)
MRRNGSPSANDSPALNRVHRGDCLDLLARMPDASVHLAFADPPFNIGYDYDAYDDRLAADVYLAWSKQWMGEVARVLRSDGTFWLAIGDEYAAELKVIATRELGFTCRSWVVWYYTFGVNCKQKFSRSHAHLFHFVKNPAAFTFNTDAIRVPSARELVYGDKRACPTGRLPDDTWILRPQDLPEGFAADGDTWYFPRVCGTFKERSGWHGCQMPEQLLGRIIRASSHEDDVVLDPFGGSGTTLAVAKKLGRRFIGLELSEQYATRIDDRLAAISPGDPLDGAPEPLKSVPATKNGRLAKKARRAGKKATLKKAAASQRLLFQKGRSPR